MSGENFLRKLLTTPVEQISQDMQVRRDFRGLWLQRAEKKAAGVLVVLVDRLP